MNNPAGFDLSTYAATGEVVDVDPWAAMFNGNVWIQFAHLLPATYVVTGFLVASVYAVGWARGRRDRSTVWAWVWGCWSAVSRSPCSCSPAT